MNSDNSFNVKRIYSFDLMRILAVCAVILSHVSADYIKQSPNDSMDFVCNNIFNSLSRFAIPMFFMISGALMLNEDKPITAKKGIRNVLNIFLLLVIWSLFYSVGYYIIKPLFLKEQIVLSDFIYALFNGHYHMWYLFVLIGLYLITPILRTFIKRENLHLIKIYLIISIILCFVVSFLDEFINLFTVHENLLSGYLSNYRLDYIYEYIIYYILGWYIANTEIKYKNRVVIYICGLFGLLSMIICTQLFFDNSLSQDNYFYSNDSLNVFLYGVSTFVFIYYYCNKKNFIANRFLLNLSQLSFGVYIVHPIILFFLKRVCKMNFSLLETIVIFIGATIISFMSIYVVSKIPILKKLIRG